MPDPQRIAPLADDEITPEAAELIALAQYPGAIPVNIFRTFAKNPGVLRRFLPFAAKLLKGGKLPERDREIVILRAAKVWNSAYEWGQHELIGREIGMVDADLAAIADLVDPAGHGALSEHELALVSAVDELRAEGRVADPTWERLAASYDEPRLIELLLVAGLYTAVAFFLRSAGVQPEPELPHMP